MKVHLFVATSSPSCAAFCLRRVAKDFGAEFEPVIASTVERSFYIDDLLELPGSIAPFLQASTFADGATAMFDCSPRTKSECFIYLNRTKKTFSAGIFAFIKPGIQAIYELANILCHNPAHFCIFNLFSLLFTVTCLRLAALTPSVAD